MERDVTAAVRARIVAKTEAERGHYECVRVFEGGAGHEGTTI